MKRIMAVVAIVGLSIGLFGCDRPPVAGDGLPQTARQAVAAVGVSYATVRTAFETYADLPRCGPPPAPPVCSDPRWVVKIGENLKAARASIRLAESAVSLLPDATPAAAMPPETVKALNAAKEAVSGAENSVSAAKAGGAP